MTKRKQGGQPNNKNAMRHGFYSQHFTAAESKMLNEVNIDTIISQINLLQVTIDRLMSITDISIETYTDSAGVEHVKDHYISQLTLITAQSLAIGTHLRTALLASGKTGEADLAIMEAIELLQSKLKI